MIVKAADFILDIGGKLLNGLVTFIDWGYKAYDATRGFIKSMGGENFAKGFDQFIGAVDTALFLTSVLAADLALEAMTGGGDGFGGDVTRRGARGVFGRGIGRAGTRLGLKTIGKSGVKNAVRILKPFAKRIPVIGGLIEFGFALMEGDSVGKAAFKGVGATLFGAIGAALGGPFALFTGAGAAYVGGIAADKLYDYLFSNKKSQNSKVQKKAGGGITRGGKTAGGVKRTVAKQKYKRVIKKVPKQPGKVEIKEDTDAGQKEKVFDFFGFVKNVTNAVNPFNTVRKTGEELGKTDYFGPILAITSKLTLGQQPTKQDYQNVGLGINLLLAKGIQQKQLKGGIIAAFAEGGMVDPDVLSAAETGGDISNWVAKTFQGEIESNAQKTLRMIRENAEKKKTETTETPPPDIDIDSAGTSGGGTADTSMNPYRRAFLDTLAYAEGTANYPNTGYNTMFTGKQFSGYKDHPRKLQSSGRYTSDAAGRYQFLSTTWDGLGLADFSPANQDKGALKLLAPHVLQAIDKGDFATAFHGARKTWASLPGAGYGQPEKKMKTLVGYANTRLEKYKKGEIGKPVFDTIRGETEPISSGKFKIIEYITGDRNHPNFELKGHGMPANYHDHIAFSTVEEKESAKRTLISSGIKIGSEYRPGDRGYHGSNLAIDIPGYQWGGSGSIGNKEFEGSKRVRNILGIGSRVSKFHGGTGVSPRDGFMLKLHKGEMFKVVDKDSAKLLGYDLTKEIIDIENKAQLVARAPSIIEKLKLISGYTDYEQPYAEPQVIEVPVEVPVPVGGGSYESSGGIGFSPSGGGDDPYEDLYMLG